jgi:hypothetical protein
MKISPHYTEKQWNDAFDGGENWNAAIDIVEDRIRGRWLTWADQIVDERYSGFAVLALDCIVLESLWGFMNGNPFPQGQERQAYRNMLGGVHFRWNDAEIDSFRRFCPQRPCARRRNKKRVAYRKNGPSRCHG